MATRPTFDHFVRSKCAFTVLLAGLLVGCGEPAKVAPISGVVKLDGDPVADAAVAFFPRAGGRSAYAVTGADGSFELTTFEQGDGAAFGMHDVSVTAVDETPIQAAPELDEGMESLVEAIQTRSPMKKWRVPEVFADPKTSGLEYEVVRGDNPTAELLLKTP